MEKFHNARCLNIKCLNISVLIDVFFLNPTLLYQSDNVPSDELKVIIWALFAGWLWSEFSDLLVVLEAFYSQSVSHGSSVWYKIELPVQQ